MKFFLAFVCVILAVFATAEANDCTVDGHTFKVGQTYWKPGKCLQYTCNGPNSFSAKTCPNVEYPKLCQEIPQDNSKPFPLCCPKIEC